MDALNSIACYKSPQELDSQTLEAIVNVSDQLKEADQELALVIRETTQMALPVIQQTGNDMAAQSQENVALRQELMHVYSLLEQLKTSSQAKQEALEERVELSNKALKETQQVMAQMEARNLEETKALELAKVKAVQAAEEASNTNVKLIHQKIQTVIGEGIYLQGHFFTEEKIESMGYLVLPGCSCHPDVLVPGMIGRDYDPNNFCKTFHKDVDSSYDHTSNSRDFYSRYFAEQHMRMLIAKAFFEKLQAMKKIGS